MKNNVGDLNNYLFETLERLMDDDLTEEQMQQEIARSQAVTKVAEVIIENGSLALRAMTVMNEYGIADGQNVPSMFTGTGSKNALPKGR